MTVAAVITSMVSLFLFGMTLLIQQAFDNQLAMDGGVKMIVYVRTAPTGRGHQGQEALESGRRSSGTSSTARSIALGAGQKLFAADPESLRFLSAENIPSYFSVEPVDKESTNS